MNLANSIHCQARITYSISPSSVVDWVPSLVHAPQDFQPPDPDRAWHCPALCPCVLLGLSGNPFWSFQPSLLLHSGFSSSCSIGADLLVVRQWYRRTTLLMRSEWEAGPCLTHVLTLWSEVSWSCTTHVRMQESLRKASCQPWRSEWLKRSLPLNVNKCTLVTFILLGLRQQIPTAPHLSYF